MNARFNAPNLAITPLSFGQTRLSCPHHDVSGVPKIDDTAKMKLKLRKPQSDVS